MSALRPRRLVTTGGLSLALALAAPLSASADPGAERGSSGERAAEQGQGQRAEQGKGTPPGEEQEQQAQAQERRAEQEQGRQKAQSRPERTPQRESAGAPERAPRRDADPRGNNGTVKVDGLPFDDGRGNEPHVGCVFAVDFYGFDAGDTATLTLSGHAPTGGGLLHSQSATISDDAAGGGQDRDATIVLSVQDQLSELLSVTPHPQQGWHVKLAVDVHGAPGGAKQKVFWIDCPPAPATTTDTAGTTTEPAVGAASDEVVVRKQDISETSVAPALGSGTEVLSGTAAEVAGATVSAATGRFGTAAGAGRGAAGEDLTAQGAVRPLALPFTGVQGLAALLAAGLGAVGAGAAALRLGRRRAAAAHAL